MEVEADRIEVLLEIGESRRVLTIDKDHLVFSVENELGKVGKDGILAYIFHASLEDLIVAKTCIFCSVGMLNGILM